MPPHTITLPPTAVSPDLSSIEHVWDEMERRLRHLPNQPVTLAEMGPALIRIWNNIPDVYILVEKINCALQKKQLKINITIKFINCVQFLVE
jgi:transposase